MEGSCSYAANYSFRDSRFLIMIATKLVYNTVQTSALLDSTPFHLGTEKSIKTDTQISPINALLVPIMP